MGRSRELRINQEFRKEEPVKRTQKSSPVTESQLVAKFV